VRIAMDNLLHRKVMPVRYVLETCLYVDDLAQVEAFLPLCPTPTGVRQRRS